MLDHYWVFSYRERTHRNKINTHTLQACPPVKTPHDLSVTQACVSASASVGQLLERLERFVRDVLAAVRGTDKLRGSNMS